MINPETFFAANLPTQWAKAPWKTPDAFIHGCSDAANLIIARTNSLYLPDTVILPKPLFDWAMHMPMPTYCNQSMVRFIMDNHYSIRSFEGSVEIAACAIVFCNSEKLIQAPHDLTWLTQPGRVREPKSVLIVKGIG